MDVNAAAPVVTRDEVPASPIHRAIATGPSRERAPNHHPERAIRTARH
jgi:hypothetical protein